MRICIDATSLLVRSAGIKGHIYHWLNALRAEAPEHEIVAFPLLDGMGPLDHERSVTGLAGTISRLALLHSVNRLFPQAVNLITGRVDVFHCSNLTHAVPEGAKLTAHIFDMTPALMPELHTPATLRADARFTEQVLRKADALIANSDSAKSDALRLAGLDEAKIEVIPPGIDERFATATPLRRPKPYVLFLGTIEPRKNIDALLDAWLELPLRTRQEVDLVLAGPAGWSSQRTLDRITSGIIGVDYLGYVPESDLPSLTAGASMFVYPSLYEGFGLPPAQAMAAGVPVITSNVSSLPEVVGDAGVLVDPRDSFAIRDAIQELLGSGSFRDELARRGRERAKKFSWKNSARRSAEFFTRVASG